MSDTTSAYLVSLGIVGAGAGPSAIAKALKIGRASVYRGSPNERPFALRDQPGIFPTMIAFNSKHMGALGAIRVLTFETRKGW
jgi:hypothetical protein